jgi:hypothetical protein
MNAAASQDPTSGTAGSGESHETAELGLPDLLDWNATNGDESNTSQQSYDVAVSAQSTDNGSVTVAPKLPSDDQALMHDDDSEVAELTTFKATKTKQMQSLAAKIKDIEAVDDFNAQKQAYAELPKSDLDVELQTCGMTEQQVMSVTEAVNALSLGRECIPVPDFLKWVVPEHVDRVVHRSIIAAGIFVFRYGYLLALLTAMDLTEALWTNGWISYPTMWNFVFLAIFGAATIVKHSVALNLRWHATNFVGVNIFLPVLLTAKLQWLTVRPLMHAFIDTQTGTFFLSMSLWVCIASALLRSYESAPLRNVDRNRSPNSWSLSAGVWAFYAAVNSIPDMHWSGLVVVFMLGVMFELDELYNVHRLSRRYISTASVELVFSSMVISSFVAASRGILEWETVVRWHISIVITTACVMGSLDSNVRDFNEAISPLFVKPVVIFACWMWYPWQFIFAGAVLIGLLAQSVLRAASAPPIMISPTAQ